MSSETVTRLELGDREIILVGTAHISRESALEVRSLIERERPDRVCVEIDESRYRSLTEGTTWRNLDITQILRQGKGFLLLSNLVLSSFQKRMGIDLGIKPGEEMLEAVRTAQDLDIPFALCDREIQVTLRRAWNRTSFWGKNKMLAVMLSAVFSNEKIDAEEIEKLKEKSILQNMMEELAAFLPSVKEVLIDERDIFLANRVYSSEAGRIVAVVGAGHVPGMVERLRALHEGEPASDLQALSRVPPKGTVSRLAPWLIPIVILGAMVAGFVLRGSDVTLSNIFKWVLINGTLASVGSVVALAYPLTVLLAFVAAPFTSLVPVVGVGLFTGVLEAALRRPRVMDFEKLNDDLATMRGFFRNRFTHVLVVFFLSSVGSAVGTFLGGIPLVASLFG